MTFPNKKYTSPSDYVEAYFEQHLKAVSSVNGEKVGEAVSILKKLYESTGTLYVCGNGGSAAISNHLACDHGKLLATDTDLLPHVHSLATNIEVITAIANDITFDEIFVHQLRLMAKTGDVVMTISSSGDSVDASYGTIFTPCPDVGRFGSKTPILEYSSAGNGEYR